MDSEFILLDVLNTPLILVWKPRLLLYWVRNAEPGPVYIKLVITAQDHC